MYFGMVIASMLIRGHGTADLLRVHNSKMVDVNVSPRERRAGVIFSLPHRCRRNICSTGKELA
jgi:hypothetical protein